MVKMHDGIVCTISDVRYVEGLKNNLLSLGQLDDLGRKEAEAYVTSHSPSHKAIVTWHRKLRHISEQGKKILMERKLLLGHTKVSLPFCKHCVISKQHRLKFKQSNSRSASVLELVHSDMWQCWVYPIKNKSDVFEVFKVYQAWVDLDSGKNIKCLRMDNGERARAMLATASLEKSFWAEAVNTTRYMINLYADGVKGYRLWDLFAHKVVVIKDVVFTKDKIQENEEGDNTTRETTSIQIEKRFQSNDSSEVLPQHGENETTESQAPTTHTRNCERKRPVWHSDYVIETNVAYCLLIEE
ncbi:gag-pol polyprotein [Tanacetum coccineum]